MEYNFSMLSKVKIFLILLIILISGYFFVSHPYRVVGQPVVPFIKGQTVLADKIVYLFRDPAQRDRIVFSSGGMDYMGIISFINIDDAKPYQVKSKDGGVDWRIDRQSIHSHVWYPFIDSGLYND